MKELTLIDLFDIFVDNIKVILICVIIGIILSIGYTKLLLKPMYESSTKIILVKPSTTNSNGQTTSDLTSNDITLNQKLVSTYSEIIKSKKVINEVIASLDLNTTSDAIAKSITVSPVKDSEVINITITNEDPNKAAAIANEIIVSFAKQVKEIYKIENVNQVDKAEPNNIPNNVSMTKNILLFAIVSLMLSYGIFFAIEYFKTTVKSPEDIEEILELPILTILPDLDEKG